MSACRPPTTTLTSAAAPAPAVASLPCHLTPFSSTTRRSAAASAPTPRTKGTLATAEIGEEHGTDHARPGRPDVPRPPPGGAVDAQGVPVSRLLPPAGGAADEG